MQQNLLMERFSLTFHREKKEMPVYVLVAARNGPKLKEKVAAPSPWMAARRMVARRRPHRDPLAYPNPKWMPTDSRFRPAADP
jgi:uncharacterized protein (TIGR03435 family)